MFEGAVEIEMDSMFVAEIFAIYFIDFDLLITF